MKFLQQFSSSAWVVFFYSGKKLIWQKIIICKWQNNFLHGKSLVIWSFLYFKIYILKLMTILAKYDIFVSFIHEWQFSQIRKWFYTKYWEIWRKPQITEKFPYQIWSMLWNNLAFKIYSWTIVRLEKLYVRSNVFLTLKSPLRGSWIGLVSIKVVSVVVVVGGFHSHCPGL